MGFWSRAWKAVKRVAKTVARQIAKVVVTIIHNIIPNGLDLLLGFLAWPEKKMRIHVFILTDPGTGKPVMDPGDITPSIDFAKSAFKDSFNVKVLKYSKDWVEVLTDTPPNDAVTPLCGTGLYAEEWGEAGEYYAKHTAGWNGIPISLVYPVTIFVVKDVKADANGCSLGPLADWIVIDKAGIKEVNSFAHEIAHACNLWHSGSAGNLMHMSPSQRGKSSKWFQRNLLRSCRHVNYY